MNRRSCSGPATSQSIKECTTVTDLGVFSDTDSVGPFQYEIDWGDGSPFSTGTADIDVPGPPTAGSFDGNHDYSSPGAYTLTMRLTDEQGGTATEVFSLTINDVLPTFADVATNSPRERRRHVQGDRAD